jgi:hypothetical protein
VARRWHVAPADVPREPSGRIKRPSKAKWREGMISPEDLEAGIYPEGDVRNRPEVRDWMRDNPWRGLPPPRSFEERFAARPRCPCCGELRRHDTGVGQLTHEYPQIRP